METRGIEDLCHLATSGCKANKVKTGHHKGYEKKTSYKNKRRKRNMMGAKDTNTDFKYFAF